MPTPVNPALLIAGPAIVQTRNATFYSKGNIAVTPRRTTFDVGTARFPTLEQREDAFTYEIRFTPSGRLQALSTLFPYGATVPGELVHGVAQIVSIDTATEIITFSSLARFRDGAPVRLATFGSAPGGLTAGTLYYLRKLTSTTGTLHTTEANALAGTSAVNISSAGTGTHRIIEEEYLKIQTYDGTVYQFHNTAVTQSPELTLSAKATALGEVVFEAYRRFATAPTNSSAFYTKSSNAFSDSSFDPADIVTQAYDIAWGSSAPWAAMAAKDGGVRIAFPLSLEAWGDDASGVQTRKITSRGAEARFTPIGVSEDDILAKLVPQDTGAGRGRRVINTDDLNISGTGLYVRLYGAFLAEPGALNYDAQIERASELLWRARNVVTAGAVGSIYYVGASAPS